MPLMSWSYAGDSSGDRYSGFAARQATADDEVLSMWACTFDLDEGGSAHGLTFHAGVLITRIVDIFLADH